MPVNFYAPIDNFHAGVSTFAKNIIAILLGVAMPISMLLIAAAIAVGVLIIAFGLHIRVEQKVK